jgi:hypothetical protein
VSEQEVHTEAPTWVPSPPARQLRVWTHVLSEIEVFDDAVAVMSGNGALMVWRYGADSQHGDVPVKGYAPGAWATFDHVGEGYARPSFRELTGEKKRPTPAANESEPELADPFVQLSPEALDDANSDAAGAPIGTVPAKIRPGEDGDDAAFRQSGDDVPFDDRPESADRGGIGPVADRGVAQATARARESLHRCAGWLGLRFRDLRTCPPLTPLPSRWWDCPRVWMGVVLTLSPVVFYLSLSS